MCVITHKTAHKKATAIRVLGNNLTISAHMQLEPRKGRSLIVEHSFGVWIAHIHVRRIVFELCLMEKKEEERKKKEQNRNFCIRFSRL